MKEKERSQVKKLKAPEFSKKTLPNYIAALLLLVLVVLMFMPFWTFTRGEATMQVSMNAYVWFPNDNTALQTALRNAIESTGKINVTHTVLQPAFMLIFGVIGAGFCLAKPSSKVAAFFPALVGALGIWCFASISIYRVLNNLWIPMLIICCLALALGVYGMIFNPKKPIKKAV